jgi:predicted transposase YbfD/YdcC
LPPDLAIAGSIDKGHGRIERRELAASSELAGYLDWPGVAQVGRIHRRREVAGKASHETVYVITSLSREQASPDALLALNRQHWSIENTLHWRRDTGFAEDASQIRCGNAPQALASLRNTVLRLLRPFPIPTRAARQVFAENRLRAIDLALRGFL